jgi:hypothetical protein
MSTLDEYADSILEQLNEEYDDDSSISALHPDLTFKSNSVNLLIGKRGSGKTTFVMKELIKLSLLGGCGYTEVFFVTDKEHDDTVEKFRPAIRFPITFVPTKDGEELIAQLTLSKNELRKQGKRVGHTIIFFDDCINLFTKTSPLAKRLYENRQALITYILAMQDVHGVSSSMKTNINTLVLFGGFSAAKFNSLFYQVPLPIEKKEFYQKYKDLSPNQYYVINLN